MEKVKYVSLKKINSTLLESLSGTRTKFKDKIKTACFEAVSKIQVLDESLNGLLDSTINSVLSSLNDREGNNSKIDNLITVFNKTNALGYFDKAPAFSKALGVLASEQSNDKLRSLLALWLDYLGANDSKQNPLLGLNKEISFIENALNGIRNSENASFLLKKQGVDVESTVGPNGIVEVLKKISKLIFDQVHGFKKAPKGDSEVNNRIYGAVEDFNNFLDHDTIKNLNNREEENRRVALECVHVALLTILHM